MNIKMETAKEKRLLKVASVLLAVLLWFYVVNQGVDNPAQNSVEVEIQYTHVPEGMQVQGPDTVTVKLWGISRELSNIEAYVDLLGTSEGTYLLPVQVENVEGVMFTTVNPDKVKITLQEMAENTIPVNIQITGKPPAGYEVLDIVPEIKTCIVKGKGDMVEKVTSVTCHADLSNATGITNFNLKPVAYTIDGSPVVEGIDIIPASIKTIAIVGEKHSARELKVTPSLEGEPAPGYKIKNVSIKPEKVAVEGIENTINAINEVLTGKIDINGKSEAFTQVVELQIEGEVNIYPESVEVRVEIEPKAEDD